MKELPRAEALELIALLRALSPGSLDIARPQLRSDLAALVSKVLPRRPRAILFDVYGTLLASGAGAEPAQVETEPSAEGGRAFGLLAEELKRRGYRGGEGNFAVALRRLVEDRRRNALSRSAFPEVDIEELLSILLPGSSAGELRRLAIHFEAARNPCVQMPGARALLARLAASPLELGIVSNAQFYTPLLLEALLGESLDTLGFNRALVAWSFELGIGKPDTEPFMRATAPLRQADFGSAVPGASVPRNDEILVIGNSSVNDIAPAAELGFMTILFAGDLRSFRPSAVGAPGSRPDSILLALGELEAVFPGES